MLDEEKLIIKRWCDLDRMADLKHMICFSDFMNANEYALFLDYQKNFNCKIVPYSEVDCLERQMVAFVPDALNFNYEYPISIIKIVAKNVKFAQKLSHRDVLGTIMGLQIERKLIGDIIISEDAYYVFVNNRIVDFILENVSRIKHTDVLLSIVEASKVEIVRSFESKSGTIPSPRLDAIISTVQNISRSQALKELSEGLIFVNSRQIYHNSYQCSEDDVISIRHFGKFRIRELGEVNKKGRIRFSYDIYK